MRICNIKGVQRSSRDINEGSCVQRASMNVIGGRSVERRSLEESMAKIDWYFGYSRQGTRWVPQEAWPEGFVLEGGCVLFLLPRATGRRGRTPPSWPLDDSVANESATSSIKPNPVDPPPPGPWQEDRPGRSAPLVQLPPNALSRQHE